MPERNEPLRASYRVQLHAGFTFADATGIVDYLADLGFSHLYCSPITRARPGSTHGYDIVDHNSLNPEIGTEAEFDTLVEALHRRQMGLILDIVPNHMGVGPDNPWWLDVLEWGPLSPYAGFFDIDWSSSRRNLEGRVLLPVLGDQFGIVLEKGEIRLGFDAEAGSFAARYFENILPIVPFDYPLILRPALERLDAARLQPIIDGFAALEGLRDDVPALRAAAQRLKRDLARAAANPAVAGAIETALAAFMGNESEPEGWAELGRLLDRQSYRPAYWRVAADEINYRRFFNINDLAGLRVEQRELFDESHRKIFALVDAGKVDGLRIDHIDGLFDPKQYVERLQARLGTPEAQHYIVVEKILGQVEDLPESWPVAGTTGYDAIAQIDKLFHDPAGERPLATFYRRFTGRRQAFDDILYGAKLLILRRELASEVAVLANEMHRLSASRWRSRDFTLNAMRRVIEEIVARFPVYRTYVDRSGAAASDRRYIDWAVGIARKRGSDADGSLYDFVHSVLTGDLAETGEYARDQVMFVAMHFQQISGPVMAKGLEDTSFYRYFPLIALNEVGGDPRRFAVSPAAFHHLNEQRLKQHPDDMLGGSTHDTKRGEDARARLACLTGLAPDWMRRVGAWSRLNRRFKTAVDGRDAPDRNDEYYVYQSLIGAWPADLSAEDRDGVAALGERLVEALRKALREGKENSSWDTPDEAYEEAMAGFLRRALDTARPNPFLADVESFVARVAWLGALTSVSQMLLRLTMPGMPDVYRGAEAWELSLVDPDNRRPIDYAALQACFAALRQRFPSPPFRGERPGEVGLVARTVIPPPHPHPLHPEGWRGSLAEVAAEWRDAGVKLLVLWRVLAFRRERPELFARGSYQPLPAEGGKAEHVMAFARTLDADSCVTVAPRLWPALCPEDQTKPDWDDTALALPDGRFHDVFTGGIVEGRVPLAALLADFPVAFLVRC